MLDDGVVSRALGERPVTFGSPQVMRNVIAHPGGEMHLTLAS